MLPMQEKLSEVEKLDLQPLVDADCWRYSFDLSKVLVLD